MASLSWQIPMREWLMRWISIQFTHKTKIDRQLIPLLWKLEDGKDLTLEELILLKDTLEKLLIVLRMARENKKVTLSLVQAIWKLEELISEKGKF